MWNYEIGLSQEIGGSFKAEAVTFRSHGNNIILIRNGRWTNSGSFNYTGYEFSLAWLPFETLEFSSSWSQIDLENQTLNTPEKKFTAYIAYKRNRYTLGGSLVHASDLFGANFRQKPLEDYTILNMFAQLKILPFVGLNFAIKNIFDTQYQTFFDYAMPGRMLTFDVSYSL